MRNIEIGGYIRISKKETVVNAFRRYNCNYEIGYYPAYYVKAVQL